MKTVLVTYANAVDSSITGYGYGINPPNFIENQKKLNDSALSVGIDTISAWDKQRTIDAGYVEQYPYPTIGDNYFSWKPFIILRTLQEYPDDIIIYCDVGRVGNILTEYPKRMIDWCLNNNGIFPGVYIKHYGKNAFWTHRDCFVYMNCDNEYYWNSPQIQTTFSIWCGKECLPFLYEFEYYCMQPKVISDKFVNECGLQNLKGFIEHRREQSVFTNLCLKHHIEAASFYYDISKDINFINHTIDKKRLSNIICQGVI
jgi:hypothetical protein